MILTAYSIHLLPHVSFCLSIVIHLSTHTVTHPSMYPTIYPNIHPSMHVCMYLFIHPGIFCPHTHIFFNKCFWSEYSMPGPVLGYWGPRGTKPTQFLPSRSLSFVGIGRFLLCVVNVGYWNNAQCMSWSSSVDFIVLIFVSSWII